MKIFKNCNVVYFKNREIFDISVGSLRGKIIISDFPEIGKLCYIHGLTHILNTNKTTIPSKKFDCIVMGSVRNTALESELINKGMSSPVVYITPGQSKQNIWCGTCNKLYSSENPVSKFCSEKCMNMGVGCVDTIKDLGFLSNKKPLIEFDKTVSEKKTNTKKAMDKFQNSVVKDAIRLEYAFKRESYKKEMKQPSFRKTNKINHSNGDSTRICKGTTKKGTRCTNRVIGSSQYCGILSHSMEAGSTGSIESAGGVSED